MTELSVLRPLALAALTLTIAGCSDDPDAGAGTPLRCPTGTVEQDGECVEDRGRADTGFDVTPPDVGTPQDTTGTPDGSPGNCAHGAVQCGEFGVPESCVHGFWVPEAACPDGEVCALGQCVEGASCEPGTVAGCVSETERRVCDDSGGAYVTEACEDGLFCFRGECGTQRCDPSSRSCEDDGRYVRICSDSGEEWLRADECNPRDNVVCVSGECVSGCAAALKNPTYIGCEYWSVDLPQFQDPFGDPRVIPHAVVVANTGDRPADVLVQTRSGIPLVDTTLTVPPGGVETIDFPRADVEDTARSMRSFQISTSEPVVAYQFNPLNDEGVASNDASLLLPANAIGREYYVMSWPSGIDALGFGAQTGWFTIVGTSEQPTTVDITFTAPLIDGADHDLQGIQAGDTVRYSLEQFEVINFEAQSAMFAIGDLTGSHIVADRPIVVFGGHEEAVIGEEEPGGGGPCCADHMEQQLFPYSTWGSQYAAVHSPPRGTEPDVWRVLAGRDGTRLTTVPPIPGLNGVTLNAGEFAEVHTTESFEISGSHPISVAQFLVSQQDYRIDATKGDPAMVLAVAAEQYRSDYVILTPEDYSEDWVTVIRPVGVEVLLDGSPIPASTFQSFGSGTLEFGYVAVEPGPHTLIAPSEEGFGIAAFGYNTAVSYGYPGGLNLATEFDIFAEE